MKYDVPLIITAIAVSMLFVGSLIVYPLNPYSFGSDVEFDSGAAEVTIYSRSPTEYGVCSYDILSTMNTDRNVYIFFDSSYASITGVGWQREIVSDIMCELDLRNYRNGTGLEVKEIDAAGLKDLMNGSADPSEYNIVFASGAFPILADGAFADAVADTAEMVKDWVDNGGMITWLLEKFGYYFAPADPRYSGWLTDPLQPGAEGILLFLDDSDDIINPSSAKAYARDRTELADAISLIHNEVTHGILTSYVESNGVVLGYTGGGYSSVSFLYNEHQTGGYLIFGGGISENTGMLPVSVGQMIASGLYGADTDTVVYEKGTMKGSKKVNIAVSGDGVVYVYTGFVASTYGKLHLQ
jgi:hypothetical protein